MDSQTRLGLELVAAALFLGITGDALLRDTPWSLNAGVWLGLLACTGAILRYRWAAGDASGLHLAWFGLLLAPSGLYLWRDAAMLKLATAIAVLAALGALIQRAQWRYAEVPPDLGEAPGLVSSTLRAIAGFPRFVVRDVEWSVLYTEDRGRLALSVGRGVLLALPPVLAFGALLSAADAVFERAVGHLIDLDVTRVPLHLAMVGAVALVAGGVMRGFLLDVRRAGDIRSQPGAPADKTRRKWLGITEGATVVGSVNVLFAAFVLVQLPYLFGGLDVVAHTDGLTIAQYARRGFFELVLVAALALPFVYALNGLIRYESPRQIRLYRVLAGTTVVLLLLILASAAQRMYLYQSVYGLTVLRVYVSAVMVWLALVLVAFTATVLRSRSEQFAPASVASGLLVVLALNVLNPDALIARVNVARALEGKAFDAAYAANLSADAVPVLLKALPSLPTDDQHAIAVGLFRRWGNAPDGNWRTWNYARAAAHRLVHTNYARLDAAAGLSVNAPPVHHVPPSPFPSSGAAPLRGNEKGRGAGPPS